MASKIKILVALVTTLIGLTAFIALNSKPALNNITFTTIRGETFDLASLKNNTIILTFWSTDCPSCIEEIPHLIELHKKYSSKGLKIIAVAMDYTPPNQVIAMSDSKQIPYSVVLDPEGTIAKQFGRIDLTPTTFVLNKEGSVEKHIIGLLDITTISSYIETCME